MDRQRVHLCANSLYNTMLALSYDFETYHRRIYILYQENKLHEPKFMKKINLLFAERFYKFTVLLIKPDHL